jgi:hypothetical protein
MTGRRKMSPLAREILDGLHGALARAKGKPTPGTVEQVVLVPDVTAIREALGLSQSEFSDIYNIPLPTLKGWGATPPPSRCNSGGVHSDDCLVPEGSAARTDRRD